MITTTEQRNVATNAGQSASYTIEANGKAFRTLISTLYSDKVKAITQEIWSNAWDGHLAKGNQARPFEITFPSLLNASFRVRDFGISLSHEDVMVMYTTLFKSTKENSEHDNGKFGLGSKTPFAYTDTFSVTTFKDGVKRMYAAVIGNDDIPTINYMGEFATEEEDGVEIMFPVHNSDIKEFRTKAQRVAYGFDVKPVVTNEEEFTGWDEFDKNTQGTDWFTYNGTPFGYGKHPMAKMGCVLYPIDVNKMDTLTSEEKDFLNANIIIEFPMGALEMTPSREALSYGKTDPTEKSIKDKVCLIITELTEESIRQIKEAPNLFEAMRINQKVTHYNIPSALRNTILKNATWDGKSIPQRLPFPNLAIEHDGPNIGVCIITGRQALGRLTYPFRTSYSLDVIPMKDTIIVLEDLTLENTVKRVPSRVKKLASDKGCAQIVWIRFVSGKKAALQMQKVLEIMDGVPVYLAEDLEAPDAVYRGGSVTRKPVHLKLHNYNNRFNIDVILTDDEIEKGGIYTPILRGNATSWTSKRLSGYNSQDIFNSLQTMGAISGGYKQLVGVPGTYHTKFEKMEQWKTLEEVSEDFLENTFDYKKAYAYKFTEVYSNAWEASRYSDWFGNDLLVPTDTLLGKTIKKMRKNGNGVTNKSKAGLRFLQKHVREQDSDVEVKLIEKLAKKTQDAADELAALDDAYPLLKVVANNMSAYHNIRKKEVDKLLDYVYMCERDNQTIAVKAAA